MQQKPTVHILLATFNGQRFLADQLESIARQTYPSWTLTVSDDGSTDDTLKIVERFSRQVRQPVTLIKGPQKGSPTANFLHLVAKVQAENFQDLYAYCDQDDVWYDNKLERAVLWHEQHADQSVRLYCGRTQFTNEELNPIGLSSTINRPPSFCNSLVQNIASGNTMVFSHAVLFAQKKVDASHSVWHDWTTYIVTTALGGLVGFDNDPCLFYRQHDLNVIGSNDGFKAQISRLKPIFEGRFKRWSDINSNALHDLQDLIAQRPRETLTEFHTMRSVKYWPIRVLAFYKSDIRRQNFFSNLTFAFALAIKKI